MTNPRVKSKSSAYGKAPSFIPVFEHADIDRKMADGCQDIFKRLQRSAGSPKPRAKSLLDPIGI